jgi:hypothetical protein
MQSFLHHASKNKLINPTLKKYFEQVDMMTPPNSNIGFRLDINGLRAYAVLMVLFFHFKVPGFNAGFLGVDIFFVISGGLTDAARVSFYV